MPNEVWTRVNAPQRVDKSALRASYPVEKLTLFPTRCVDFRKHRRPKVPIGNFLLWEYKTEVHPGFYEHNKFYLIRARSARKGTPTACSFAPLGAFPCRISAKPKTGRTGTRRAPHQIPHKVQLCRTLFTARAAARPPLPCRGEGGIPSGFSGTGGVSRGDRVPPGIRVSE